MRFFFTPYPRHTFNYQGPEINETVCVWRPSIPDLKKQP